MTTGLFIAFSIWYMVGWINAHKTVATECERLGKFFVGKKVYECTLIKEVDSGD